MTLSFPLRCLSITLLCIATSNSYAHKVNMFAYIEADTVFVEGYFNDGKRAKQSTIAVFDSTNKELLTGLTDSEGQFTFTLTETLQTGAIRITLNAGMGHQTEFQLSADETESALSVATATPLQAITTTVAGDTTNAVSNQDLQLMINKAVGKSIKPIIRSLSELKEKQSTSDIVGGIGFIVGLMGAAFFFKARKIEKEDK